MRIVHASAEVAPWCKTGGLADVVGSLPRAEADLLPPGSRVLVLCPLHRGVRAVAAKRGERLVDAGYGVAPIDGGPVGRVLLVDGAPDERVIVGFIDCPELFDRDGIYDDCHRRAWPDNPVRFSWFARAVIEVAPALLGGRPDVLHAHDWHLGLLPVWKQQHGGASVRRAWSRARVLFTIHNILYQGLASKEFVPKLGLRWEDFTMDGFEYRDQLSFLKAGVAFADVVTTVSPGHARELRTPEGGHGLDGFLRAQGDGFVGVLNGLDPNLWSPAVDDALPANFSIGSMTGKAVCRQELLKEFGLPDQGGLVLGIVSRLVWNKGLDTVAQAMPALLELGVQLVLLGSGEADIEASFMNLVAAHPDQIGARIGFDGLLARRIFAGTDAVLVPSRVEPCGLTQLQSMRYGSVPIAHPVGGLGDTVVDPGDEGLAVGEGTGFLFAPHGPEELAGAVARAARLYGDTHAWLRLVETCMRHDSSWKAPATRTLELSRDPSPSDFPGACL